MGAGREPVLVLADTAALSSPHHNRSGEGGVGQGEALSSAQL